MLKKSDKILKKMLYKKESKPSVIPKIEASINLKCYICNQNLSISTGVELLKTKLLGSNGSIPQKIVKIMGDDCMVLVSEDDHICIKCVNLFNKLDRLEIEITKILDEITNYLNIKYNISSNITIPIPPQIKHGTKRKYPDDMFENQLEIEKQLSEMFGSPVTVMQANQTRAIAPKKNIKSTLLFRCPLCRQGFNDKTLLHFHMTDTHISKNRCNICQLTFKDSDLLRKHITKNNCKKINTLSIDNKKFKCAICSQKFETKELLNIHLKKHKTAYFKCGSCGESFQKRDLLMKHLELHTKNKSTVKDNSINNKKEIKFIDCKSCALTYIDNEHYSSHLNSSAHRKTKFDIKTEEKIDTTLNQIDLEQIFEKLHSDVQASDDNVTGGNGTDLTSDHVIDLLPTDSVLDETKNDKNHGNKVYLYKCPGCTDLYDNSNDLQLHILTVGHHHVDYNSEIQILEVDNTNNLIGQSIDIETKNKTANNNEIKILSLDDNNTNNIQFITSDDGNEIKFITFHNDHTDNNTVLLSDNTVLSNNNNTDNNPTYHHDIQQNNTNKNHDIHELFQNVVEPIVSTSAPTATTITSSTIINNTSGGGGACSGSTTERSKIQIIDEKTIDISQFINIHKKNIMSKSNYQLNDLCTLSIKSETQSNNQVISNIIPTQIVSSSDPTNTEIKTIGVSSIIDQKDTTSLMFTPQRKIYKCCRCDFKCLTHDIIKAHMTKHNNNNANKINIEQQSENLTALPPVVDDKGDFSAITTAPIVIANANENETTAELQECKQCKQNFKSLNMLKRHKNTFHRAPICAYCNKQMKNLHILRIHEQSHINRGDVCKCDDCGKEFKTKCGLNNHRPMHTGNYKLFCDYCNRGFMSKVVLEEHRSKHTKEERVICDICGKKFQFRSTYWIHRKWHDNPYPYKCNFCNRKFRHTSLLAVHKRKHTGERPYECPHCKQTFAVSGTLKCHLILHTGVYPYTCDICQRGFTTRHKYAVHLSKTHGNSNLLTQNNDKQNNFKMVIKEIDNIDEISTSSSKNDQGITSTNLESVIDNHMLMNEVASTGVMQVSSADVKCNGTVTTSILNNWYEDNSSIIASLVDS